MKIIKKLTVPLCDITSHLQPYGIQNYFISQSSEQQSKIKECKKESVIKRTRQQKRKLESDDENDKGKSEEDSDSEEREEDNDSDYVPDSERENKKKLVARKKNYFKAQDSEEENKEILGEDLSEYEKMVLKNREEKLVFLKSLKIDEVKEEFKEVVNNLSNKPKKHQKVKTFKKSNDRKLSPVRKSRRLAKLDVNLSEGALYEKAISTALEERKEKTLPQQYSFEEAVEDKEDYSDFINNFEFTATSEDEKSNNDYVSHFKQMKLKESNIAKVVPTRISTLAVHPSTDNIIVIAGSKYGHLGFWNVTSDSNPVVFLPHNGGVTNVKVNPHNPLQIVSSSYDGTVRFGDINKKIFSEVYNVSEETCCTYFDFVSPTTFLVSQRNGNVSVVDVRDGSLKSEKTHDCHDYSVKTVSVHPVNKSLFLTSDCKGILKLWDLRKLQKKPIINVSHHKRNISSAFFSPVTGKSILTTSSDDTLCLFDSSNIEKEILFDISIRHNNMTGRWLTPFKATWLPNSDDAFVVGSMLYPRRVEIFNSNGNIIYNFNDENLTSVTSVNQFHPSLNVLAGANSSGKVFVFMDTK